MESWETKLARWKINFFPAYRGTGAWVDYIASDWHEIRVRLPLSWRTRNLVGTIFGGSLYGAIDPMYMIMLMRLLGRDYIVWDKAACIQFKKPGKSTLYAAFKLSQEEIDDIRRQAQAQPSLERVYEVTLNDAAGVVHAVAQKTIYIRWKGNQRES